ncbi:transmembrane protein 211 [Tachysurus ichikawai]
MHVLLDRDRKEAAGGTGTMFSCVGCFWLLLTAALVALCSFSFISPAWIVKEQHHGRSGHSVSFGLLWHCSESLDHMYTCYAFGGIGRFAEIPSSSWQANGKPPLLTGDGGSLRGSAMGMRITQQERGNMKETKSDLILVVSYFFFAVDRELVKKWLNCRTFMASRR